MVLSGAPLIRLANARRSPWAYRMVRALHRRRLISEARMEAARQKYGSRDYRNATGLLREILVASVNENFEAQLAQVTAPVSLVWGANDHDVPIEVARRISALLVHSPDVELDVLAETGHLVPDRAARAALGPRSPTGGGGSESVLVGRGHLGAVPGIRAADGALAAGAPARAL